MLPVIAKVMALTMPRGMNRVPAIVRRIAEQPLAEQRHDRHPAEQADAIGGDGERTRHEIAVPEQRQVDDVVGLVPAAEEEGGAGEDGDDGADDDGLGIEPVAHLALVEDVLQRADGEHQKSHAHPVGLDVP